MRKKILFTGGGTPGHVTPNLAIIEKLQKLDYDISYIGEKGGVEEGIITKAGVKFSGIICDKLRRYMSFRHMLAPFKILIGFIQSFFIIFSLQPRVVFSKGGYVALPVCFAAWFNRIKVIVHESDLTPGLANKICFAFADYICVTHEKTISNISSKFRKKAIVTGSPIRSIFDKANAERGRKFLGFNDQKPLLLVFGGGMGSEFLNNAIRENLLELAENYQIIHVCGKGKVDSGFVFDGYLQVEYINNEFADVIAASNLVLARAGANSIYEILLLKKPCILIPLSRRASRGDQIENAMEFANQGAVKVIQEEEFEGLNLLKELRKLEAKRPILINNIEKLSIKNGTDDIIRLIEKI